LGFDSIPPEYGIGRYDRKVGKGIRLMREIPQRCINFKVANKIPKWCRNVCGGVFKGKLCYWFCKRVESLLWRN
jgi:hypothetical protein